MNHLFKLWIEQNYPRLGFILTISVLLTVVTLVTSIVLPFFSVSWWWKLLVLSVGTFLLIQLITLIVLRKLYNDFLSGKKKIKL